MVFFARKTAKVNFFLCHLLINLNNILYICSIKIKDHVRSRSARTKEKVLWRSHTTHGQRQGMPEKGTKGG
jgi:hypothetical protein